MIGKIKALSLAFIAITAMSAVAAGSAQAQTLSSFHVGLTPAVITGHSDRDTVDPLKFQQHVLTLKSTSGGNFSSICDTSSLEGTSQAATITALEVTATYSSCKLFGLAASVQMHGCKYTLTGVTNAPLTANVDITGCTKDAQGKPLEITIKNLTCTLDIPEQSGLAHIVFHNEPATNHVTAEATVTGIEVTQTGAGCPDGNNHVSKNASFTGNTTLTAFKDEGFQQVTEHGHQFNKLKDGAATTLVAT